LNHFDTPPIFLGVLLKRSFSDHVPASFFPSTYTCLCASNALPGPSPEQSPKRSFAEREEGSSLRSSYRPPQSSWVPSPSRPPPVIFCFPVSFSVRPSGIAGAQPLFRPQPLVSPAMLDRAQAPLLKLQRTSISRSDPSFEGGGQALVLRRFEFGGSYSMKIPSDRTTPFCKGVHKKKILFSGLPAPAVFEISPLDHCCETPFVDVRAPSRGARPVFYQNLTNYFEVRNLQPF